MECVYVRVCACVYVCVRACNMVMMIVILYKVVDFSACQCTVGPVVYQSHYI